MAAEVKRLEADIADATANKLRDLAAAQSDLKGNTEDATNSLLKQAGALERLGDGVQRVGEISAQEKALDLAERAAAVERKQRNIDKQGYALDNDGNRLQQSVPYENYVLENAKSQGLSEATAVELLDQFFQNGRAIKPAGSSTNLDWFSAVNKAIADRVVQETRQRAAAPGAQQGGGANYISNITLNGTTSHVRFADRESQNATEALLRELERAKLNTGR